MISMPKFRVIEWKAWRGRVVHRVSTDRGVTGA